MLGIAALVLASASATPSTTPSPALVSTAPWFEKVTITMSGDGKPQSCKYETNLQTADPSNCDVSSQATASATSSDSSSDSNSLSAGKKDELTRITFERRFDPGTVQPTKVGLQPGDTLLGGQVMAINIDSAGAVQGCEVVAKAGDLTPEYGCDEAQTEHFDAKTQAASAEPRQGFMTVLVYGHEEQLT